MALSETYIIPNNFSPDEIDPITKKNYEPIITFDDSIVGQSAESKITEPKEAMEEVEIFEYRAMQDQLKIFSKIASHKRYFKGIEYPANLSAQVITCDNSEFSKELLAKNDNHNREGFVYSVPFYDPAGNLKGLISAVIRTKVLERKIKSPFISLISEGPKAIKISNVTGIHSAPYVIDEEIPLSILDDSQWKIKVKVPLSEFRSSLEYSQVQKQFIALMVFSLVLSLLFSILVFQINQTKIKAQVLAQKITNENIAIQAQLVANSKLSSLGEMAGGIAHEINNPLAIISGKVESLQRRIQNGNYEISKILEDLSKIQNTVNRIAKIIVGLRAFSRNAEKDPMVPTKISTIVDDTLELCQEKFRKNGVELRVNCDKVLEVECRASQLAQVLINLLGNAHDAVEKLSEKWVSLNVVSKDNIIRITVVDSGFGIPSDIVNRMMEPFYTTKEVGKGTGLGLSISKGIIEDHGGSLQYDHTAKNTTFIIEIPIIASNPGATNTKSA